MGARRMQPKREPTPWTDTKRERMRADPESWPMIWILIDAEEAQLLSDGNVPESVAEQADLALKANA